MIKNVAYFPLQCARNSIPVMNAVLDYLQSSGIQTQENSWDSDAVVIWSVLWNGRMADNQQVYEHYRRLGRPVIVIDIGALYRGVTWKIAVNNINADGYYGHQENLDLDRPNKLRISLAQPVFNRAEIIIAAQHRKSLQVEKLSSVESWVTDQLRLLKTITDRPVIVRPHPRCQLDMDLLPRDVVLEQPHPLANTYDSFDMHFDCHAVVNYNSGPGIQAAISGCRPIVDPTSLAHPVSVDINDIETPYDVDRYQWLVEICHTEYTLNEIQRGLWFQRILPALSIAPV